MNQSTAQIIRISDLQNLSEDQKYDQILRGLMGDVRTELSKFQELDVVISTDKYDKEELPCHYLMNGSFFEASGLIRLNYQITRIANKKIVFATRIQHTYDNLLSQFDLIVQQITHSLKNSIESDLLSDSQYTGTGKMEVRPLYLNGVRELKKGTNESDMVARDYFIRALRLDSNFSQAYSGLARSYLNEFSYQFWNQRDESIKKAQALASRAIELNRDNYEALAVLSKVHFYNGDFGRANDCIKKSLEINPNDAELLASHAFTLCYMGEVDKASRLFENSLIINPSIGSWYKNILAVIEFKRGNYTHAIEIGRSIEESQAFVELELYIAASESALDIPYQTPNFWEIFIDRYQKRIAYSSAATEAEAVDWLKESIPLAHRNDLLEFVKNHGHESVHKPKPTLSFDGNILVKKLDHWRLEFQGFDIEIPHMKGVEDLARLLVSPEEKVHCSDLMGIKVQTNHVEVIDQQAKNEYKKKLLDLQEQMEDAESFQDYEKLEKLRDEYEELSSFISKALQINGRSRKVGNSNEKARTAITWRIRHAVTKIMETNETLGRHLKTSIKTGTYCYYAPELPYQWELITDYEMQPA